MADKTIKDVVKQLEDTNKLLQETLQKDDALLSLQDSSGIVGKIARQMERNAEKEREKQAEDQAQSLDKIDKASRTSADSGEEALKVATHQDLEVHSSKEHLQNILETQPDLGLAENLDELTADSGRALVDLVDLARVGNDETTLELAKLVNQGEDQIEAAEAMEMAQREAAREAARKEDKPTIEVAVNMEPPEEEDGFLMWVLKALGLIGAGAAGLAAGLLVGWLAFVGDLLKRLGKIFKLDKIKLPKWLDDFFKAFSKEGKLYKNTMKYIDDFKAPKWLDNFVKQFTKEGKIAKKVMKIIDNFKMPKFLDDFFKAFTKEGKLGKKIMKIIDNFKMPKFKIFDMIGDFFKSTDKFKDISKAIKGVKDVLPKGGAGGTFGKFFKSIGEVFKPIGNLWKSVKGFFTPLTKLFGPGGGSMIKTFTNFLTPFKTVFKAFAGLGKAIAAPLTIIMGIIDGFFEAKDAVGKSEGIMATMVNAVVGAIGGFIDGAIFQLLDLLKSGISWIAGFFGFTEVEKFLDSFSFSEMFNEFLDDVYAWFNTLFSDPVKALTDLFSSYFGAVLSVGDFIVDMIKKPIVWLLELFGWDDAAAGVEEFSFSGTVMKVFDAAVAWIKGLFTDPIGALTSLVSGYFGGLLSIADWLVEMIKKPIVWLLGIFGWDDAAEAVDKFSLKGFVFGIFDKVKAFFTGIFSWASEEDESDSWIVKKIKGIVTGIKEWFGSMFQFDSASGVLKTVMNIMMWIPNLFVKAVAGITSWFAGLLGFEAESEAIAKAGKDFSFGDLIFKAVKAIGDYFSDLFDSIVNFDFGSLAKSIMPAKLYDWIFGGGPETGEKEEAKVKQAEEKFDKGKSEKSKKELDSMGFIEKGSKWNPLDKDNLDIAKIQAALAASKNDKAEQAKLISALTLQLGDTAIAEDDRQQLAAVLELTKGVKHKAEGGLVGLSSFASGTLGSAMGLESGGLFTLTQGEMVLDNQAAQTFLQAAMILKGQDLSGQSLMDLERDKQRTGGSSSTVVVNNTTSNQVNSSQPVVLPVSGVSPASPETRMS